MSNNSDIDITEDQVTLYLKNNPGFFLKRDDLLCDLQLAHPSGGAVSLLERQVSLLRERNLDMRARLNSLLDNARDNDKLFEKTKKLVLALLEARNLEALVSCFNRHLQQDFTIAFTSLILFGEPEHYRQSNVKVLPFEDANNTIPGLLKSQNATCGVLRPEEFTFLFTHQASEVGSAAVVPLNHGRVLGIIAIGSSDPQYFRSSMGTLFLGYIAEVLNRVLPKLMHKA